MPYLAAMLPAMGGAAGAAGAGAGAAAAGAGAAGAAGGLGGLLGSIGGGLSGLGGGLLSGVGLGSLASGMGLGTTGMMAGLGSTLSSTALSGLLNGGGGGGGGGSGGGIPMNLPTGGGEMTTAPAMSGMWKMADPASPIGSSKDALAPSFNPLVDSAGGSAAPSFGKELAKSMMKQMAQKALFGDPNSGGGKGGGSIAPLQLTQVPPLQFMPQQQQNPWAKPLSMSDYYG